MRLSLRTFVLIISVVTCISGITQMLNPGLVLNFIGTEVTPASSHFFGIVGMFMTLFGGLMIHALYSVHPNQVAVLWCALQKLGAFVAVGLGIIYEVFSVIAAGVALFDLFSGVLFLFYLKTLQTHETA